MGTIVPFLKTEAVFEPDDIQAMSIALDDVCKTLNLTDHAKAAREVIAERIIELARGGERSPTVLRDRVLLEAGLSDGGNAQRRWSGL
jgi:ABC-type hemin transport system substrate-binding protein